MLTLEVNEPGKRNDGRLHFRDLTAEQVGRLSNGCGPKGFVKVPDFVFRRSCQHHDFKYWRGKSGSLIDKSRDRRQADLQFLFSMFRSIERRLDRDLWRDAYRTAHIYFSWCRRAGWLAYNWGPERGAADLDSPCRGTQRGGLGRT